MSNAIQTAEYINYLIIELSFLVGKKFFETTITTNNFLIKASDNCFGIFVGNGFDFWPFNEVFHYDYNVSISPLYNKKRSDQINFYMVKWLSNTNMMKRLFPSGFLEFLAGLAGLYIVFNIVPHLQPKIVGYSSLIGNIEDKMSG